MNLDTANLETVDSDPSPLPFTFTAYFQGTMGMNAPAEQVAAYLNAHDQWFVRCAQPMIAKPLGPEGYILTVGKFSSFGYDVEPKMGVVLEPPQAGIYNMYSVEVPGYEPPGYQIDYVAALTLQDCAAQDVAWVTNSDIVSPRVTQVSWYLNLHITLQFPNFIYRLPHELLQHTGDTGLAQIIRQVSPRLTYKVQRDFHQQQNRPVPPRSSRQLVRVSAATTSL